MSSVQEHIEENGGLEALAEETIQEAPAVEDKARPSPESYTERQEALARNGGWKPFEDWVEGGGDPDEWRSAEAFNIRGEFIGKLKHKDKEIEERLANVNRLHEIQLKAQREELLSKRDQAIEEGDLKGVHKLDKQIQDLSLPQPAQPQVDPLLSEWNAQNTWIDQPGAKSTYAKSLYAEKRAAGWTTQAILQHVNTEIAREFPSTQTRSTIADAEKGKTTGFRKPSKALTMADVTPEERKWRDAMPNAWKDDKAFLQAVADSRSAT